MINARVNATFVHEDEALFLSFFVKGFHLFGNVAGRDEIFPKSQTVLRYFRVKRGWKHADDQIGLGDFRSSGFFRTRVQF